MSRRPTPDDGYVRSLLRQTALPRPGEPPAVTAASRSTGSSRCATSCAPRCWRAATPRLPTRSAPRMRAARPRRCRGPPRSPDTAPSPLHRTASVHPHHQELHGDHPPPRPRGGPPRRPGSRRPGARRRAAYLERGFAPLPLPFGAKEPTLVGWPDLRFDQTALAAHFGDAVCNVSLILGRPAVASSTSTSTPPVLALAHWLPDTDLIAGRPGKPASHRYYRAVGAATRQFKDPVGKAMLIELRGTGAQTVVPPSVHPSGESYRWERDGEPAVVEQT